MSRGQDLGDGAWPVLAALLPRAAQVKASPSSSHHVSVLHRSPVCFLSRPLPSLPACPWAECGKPPARRACGQVGSGGDVAVVSGVGAKGTSSMALSGEKGLGPDGAERLAALLREAAPPMLEAMDLRCLFRGEPLRPPPPPPH